MSGFANEAGWDRIGRVALGAVLMYLGWGEVVSGALGTFLKFFGLIPLITGIAGWCPIYAAFRFRTNSQTAGV